MAPASKKGLSAGRLIVAAIVFGAIAAGTLAWLGNLEPAQYTIVDLELARTGGVAEAIRSAWRDTATIDTARQAIIVDFAFIVGYALALAALCRLAVKVFLSKTARALGAALSIGMIVAGAFDAVENISSLLFLANGGGAWATIATMFAWPKFMIVLIAVVYLVFALIKAIFFRWLAGPRAPKDAIQESARSTTQVFSGAARPEWTKNDWDPAPGKIGVSCSGGGVRSAAYNLGALQVMTERGLMAKASYLTAVSGGCYIAGAMTMMKKGLSDVGNARAPFEPRSPEEQHFRNNSSYIAPGLGGKAWLLVRLLLGMFINLLFLWLVISVIAKPIGWLLYTRYLHPDLVEGTLDLPSSMWLPSVLTAVMGLIAALFAIINRFSKDRWYYNSLRVAAGFGALSVALSLLLVAIPAGIVLLAKLFGEGGGLSFGDGLQVTQSAGLLGVVASTLKSLASKAKGTVSMMIGSLLAPLLGIVTFLSIAGDSVGGPSSTGGAFGWRSGPDWLWFAVMAVVVIWFYRISDQTTWSMHPFYKRRLCTVYAQGPKPDGSAGPIDYDELQSLSEYAKAPGWPEFVVCAAANVTDPGATPPRRNSVSFVFTSREVGGPDIGWLRTDAYERVLGARRREDITLPAAIAISGAAVSPGMGKMTYGQVSPLIALANARLGVWLPNPRWIALVPGGQGWWSDRPRVAYLLKEVFGRYSENDSYLYVTDGGHWENLGLVELLRRGCMEIYCFDASGDQTDTFFTFGEAVALARAELGVEIAIDPEVLRPDADQIGRNRVPGDVVRGTITYPGVPEKGKIVLAKAGVRDDAPWDVRAYADKDKRFPTHSTLHQLFTDKNFEAYRSLGRFAAANAITKMNEPD